MVAALMWSIPLSVMGVYFIFLSVYMQRIDALLGSVLVLIALLMPVWGILLMRYALQERNQDLRDTIMTFLGGSICRAGWELALDLSKHGLAEYAHFFTPEKFKMLRTNQNCDVSEHDTLNKRTFRQHA